MIAALYVDPNGVYANLPGVEVWDESRDARAYAGPWPVVAHPPCNRWSLLASCRRQRDGQDGGCFAAALAAVQRFGGVLEHPAHSLAWDRFLLPEPTTTGWTGSIYGGWACAVDQHHYGHPVNKPTWLYYAGDSPPLPTLPGMRAPRSSVRTHDNGGGGRSTRSATPPAFRDVLCAMALSA